jgi:hypothetical protein
MGARLNDRARDLQDIDVEVPAGEMPGAKAPGVETPGVNATGIEVPGVAAGIATGIEMPALLLPDGSRSALCRVRAASADDADTAAISQARPPRSQRSVLTGAAAD